MSQAPEELSPSDVDPKRFRRALWIYFSLGILAVTGWQIWRYADDHALREFAESSERKVESDLLEIQRAAERFEADLGRVPENLRELADRRDANGYRYLSEIPIDPWREKPYRFYITDTTFAAFTYGQDDTEGGDGYDADHYSVPPTR
ncbi:MAG: type II secretion system protein GspG [Planctomycetota bacterium]